MHILEESSTLAREVAEASILLRRQFEDRVRQFKRSYKSFEKDWEKFDKLAEMLVERVINPAAYAEFVFSSYQQSGRPYCPVISHFTAEKTVERYKEDSAQFACPPSEELECQKFYLSNFTERAGIRAASALGAKNFPFTAWFRLMEMPEANMPWALMEFGAQASRQLRKNEELKTLLKKKYVDRYEWIVREILPGEPDRSYPEVPGTAPAFTPAEGFRRRF